MAPALVSRPMCPFRLPRLLRAGWEPPPERWYLTAAPPADGGRDVSLFPPARRRTSHVHPDPACRRRGGRSTRGRGARHARPHLAWTRRARGRRGLPEV